MENKNTSEKFFSQFEHIADLPAALTAGAGTIDLLRPLGPISVDAPLGALVGPRMIEVFGGHLKVIKLDGTEETTRDYADWDKFYGGVKAIVETGTTATAVQIYW